MKNKRDLKELACAIRKNIVDAIASVGMGHIGGCLSIADVLAVLYGKHMYFDPLNPKMRGRDRLVCSKGHAGPAIHAVLAEMGFFPKEALLTLNQGGTILPSHCDMNKTPGVDMTAGSLGQGLSCAVGIAMGSKIVEDNATVFAIIGDGESQEGQIWEAAMYAGNIRLNNLIAFTDYNKLQLDGTIEEINDVAPLKEKWQAFKWAVFEAKGHDVDSIDKAVEKAKKVKDRPSMIILDTVKGKGISFVEDAHVGCHSMTITGEQREAALCELGGAK